MWPALFYLLLTAGTIGASLYSAHKQTSAASKALALQERLSKEEIALASAAQSRQAAAAQQAMLSARVTKNRAGAAADKARIRQDLAQMLVQSMIGSLGQGQAAMAQAGDDMTGTALAEAESPSAGGAPLNSIAAAAMARQQQIAASMGEQTDNPLTMLRLAGLLDAAPVA
jgi:hypothetical protein